MEGWQKTARGWRKVYRAPQAPAHARADLPAPRVVSDVMAPTEHVDGCFYDSKSQFRRVTREQGCVEIGNDLRGWRPPPPPRPDKRELRAAVEKAVARAGI